MKITDKFIGLEVEPYANQNGSKTELRLRISAAYRSGGKDSGEDRDIDLDYQQATVLFRCMEFIMQSVAVPQINRGPVGAPNSPLEMNGTPLGIEVPGKGFI